MQVVEPSLSDIFGRIRSARASQLDVMSGYRQCLELLKAS